MSAGPADAAAAPRRAAILGGGVIGGGWAARFLLAGWDVALLDPDPEAPRKLEEVLGNARRSLPALADVALPPEGRLRFAADVADAVAGAEWIQESVPERLDVKHALFAEVQRHCDERAVLASSTSGFTPTALGEGAARPAQIVVAHPFNPVYLVPLVELVGDPGATARAAAVLGALGMHPLVLRHEIDAHLADRLLEAVWREALWLVRDGIATTAEIDDAIRYGFGLRWAQMGLFETYRIAGGEAGMAHFVAQFGPALAWPWTRLTDVPELDAALVGRIAEQSDAQSGHLSIRALERLRDDNLVAILRALKGRDHAAGALLNRHDAALRARAADAPSGDGGAPFPAAPIETVRRVVPGDWTDRNGHMNESRYGQVFSDAADALLERLGCGPAYVDGGLGWFTVDVRIRFLHETRAGEPIVARTTVLDGGGKKLRLFHEMSRGDGTPLATGEQLLVHVSLETRRSCPPAEPVAGRLAALVRAHADLERPAGTS